MTARGRGQKLHWVKESETGAVPEGELWAGTVGSTQLFSLRLPGLTFRRDFFFFSPTGGCMRMELCFPQPTSHCLSHLLCTFQLAYHYLSNLKFSSFLSLAVSLSLLGHTEQVFNPLSH